MDKFLNHQWVLWICATSFALGIAILAYSTLINRMREREYNYTNVENLDEEVTHSKKKIKKRPKKKLNVNKDSQSKEKKSLKPCPDTQKPILTAVASLKQKKKITSNAKDGTTQLEQGMNSLDFQTTEKPFGYSDYFDETYATSEWETVKSKPRKSLKSSIENRMESNGTEHSEVLSVTLDIGDYVPKVIGPKGACIKNIRERSGAKFSIDRENKKCIISGTTEQVNLAKTMVMDITNSRGQVVVFMGSNRALIHGPNGETVRRIQAESGAQIDLGSRCSINAILTGHLLAMNEARKAIVDLLQRKDIMALELVKCDLVSIIENQDVLIHSLKQRIGVNVDVDRSNMCFITGTPEQVEKAHEWIKLFIKHEGLPPEDSETINSLLPKDRLVDSVNGVNLPPENSVTMNSLVPKDRLVDGVNLPPEDSETINSLVPEDRLANGVNVPVLESHADAGNGIEHGLDASKIDVSDAEQKVDKDSTTVSEFVVDNNHMDTTDLPSSDYMKEIVTEDACKMNKNKEITMAQVEIFKKDIRRISITDSLVQSQETKTVVEKDV